MSKILAIDIGNTTIAFGLFRNNKLILNFKLPTHNKSRDFYKKNILKTLGKKDIQNIILCSVVPDKTQVLKKSLTEIFKKKILLFQKDVKIPIKNRYKNPKQVG